jgi:hypothetical protein
MSSVLTGFDEKKFQLAISDVVAKHPRFKCLRGEQVDVLRALCQGHNVLCELPTGYGKSTIVHMFPFVLAAMRGWKSTQIPLVMLICIMPLDTIADAYSTEFKSGSSTHKPYVHFLKGTPSKAMLADITTKVLPIL